MTLTWCLLKGHTYSSKPETRSCMFVSVGNGFLVDTTLSPETLRVSEFLPFYRNALTQRYLMIHCLRSQKSFSLSHQKLLNCESDLFLSDLICVFVILAWIVKQKIIDDDDTGICLWGVSGRILLSVNHGSPFKSLKSMKIFSPFKFGIR